MNRELIMRWLDKAIEQDPGSTLYIEVASHKTAKLWIKEFSKEAKILAKMGEMRAAFLVFGVKGTPDKHIWVTVQTKFDASRVGFVEKRNGGWETIVLNPEEEKWRRLQQMKDDLLTLNQIIDIEGELTEEEEKFILSERSRD